MRLAMRAYAKINWLLDVGGLRPDGYHELSTLFQTIDLYDELFFESDSQISLTLTESATNLKTDESNLIVRAAKLLQQHVAGAQGAKILLNKAIPMGGGLGGGSADAAITLIALNQLWQSGLSNEQLADLGAQLGSDVPFFFIGGTAWGTGRGTEIIPIDDIEVPHLLLVNPNVEVSTAKVYQGFDLLTKSTELHTLPPCSFSGTEELFAQVCNSLAPVAQNLCPVIAEVETQLQTLGGNPVLMSGSGATVWARFSTAAELTTAAEALGARGWLVIPTRALMRQEYKCRLAGAVA